MARLGSRPSWHTELGSGDGIGIGLGNQGLPPVGTTAGDRGAGVGAGAPFAAPAAGGGGESPGLGGGRRAPWEPALGVRWGPKEARNGLLRRIPEGEIGGFGGSGRPTSFQRQARRNNGQAK